jgi:hypothetical protein
MKILERLIPSPTVWFHDSLRNDSQLSGSVISFEIPLDGYTNLSSTSASDTGSIRGFSIVGDKTSHQYRLQHCLWNSIRIYPSFAFVPLLAPPGEGIPENDEEVPPQQTVERVADLEEIQLNSSSSTVGTPRTEFSDDVYTVRSGDRFPGLFSSSL